MGDPRWSYTGAVEAGYFPADVSVLDQPLRQHYQLQYPLPDLRMLLLLTRYHTGSLPVSLLVYFCLVLVVILRTFDHSSRVEAPRCNRTSTHLWGWKPQYSRQLSS